MCQEVGMRVIGNKIILLRKKCGVLDVSCRNFFYRELIEKVEPL